MRRFGKAIAAGLPTLMILLVGARHPVPAQSGSASESPARLDPATPSAQSGYTVIAIQRAGRSGDCVARFARDRVYTENIQQGAGATALWIRTPITPAQSTDLQGRRIVQDAFTITARLSTGEMLPLEWRARYARDPNLIFTWLPPGYPDIVRFAEILLKDRRGGVARWRLIRLPAMRHVVSTPAANDSFSEAGIVVKASAWRNPVVRQGVPDQQTTYELRASGTPNGSSSWELVGAGALNEWEAPDYDIRSSGISSQMIDSKNGALVTITRTAPYASHDRFGLVRGALRQLDTYEEKVVFHDIDVVNEARSALLRVKKPQTAKTASGITVTLPVQNATPGRSDVAAGLANGLNFVVSVQPAREANVLPASPLYKKHRRPIRIRVSAAAPFKMVSWSGTAARQKIGAQVTSPVTGRIKEFAVIVRQRVDLREIPFELTVPVKENP